MASVVDDLVQSPQNRRVPLSDAQIGKLVGLGAVLWLGAALLLRYIGPMGVYEGRNMVWLYLLIIPGTMPFVPVIRAAGGLAPHQMGIGVAIATAAALLLDGVAMAWFPQLYGAELKYVAGAAAAILWGGGVAMALGFWANRNAAA